MSEFYHKIVVGDRLKYVCVEAETQKSADASAGVFSGDGQIERTEKKDLPSSVKFRPSRKIPAAWESESSTTKPCPICGKEARLLPAGAYKQGSTWVEFDNEECLGYQCANPSCARITGAPVGTHYADPRFGLKSLDEVLTPTTQ
jgi:hypothetical protein